MGQHYVFRIQGTEYEGMRMPDGLYSAVVATAHQHKEGELPHLLADNTFRNRSIGKKQVGAFEDELSYAGQIVLTHSLINYDTMDGKEVMALDGKFTPTQAGVTLATLIELCEEAKSRNNGLSIKVEDGDPDHMRLSFEKKLGQRLSNSLYLPGTTDVRDYKARFNF